MTSIKFRALTDDEHKLFFEALGEYGKDFQNIQQYMTQKGGKSGNKTSDQNKSVDPQERKDQDKRDDDKKREQIRNFYNKIYGKLSQLVGRLDDRIEKVNQELYLLINYGEIWKKFGFKFNNKTKKLLEELVHQGFTTLRYKNKNIRLRTPSCKALKKINEIGVDEKVKLVTTRELPKDVMVEFHPATNRDWIKVQSMSQNPRVRARLSIQKRLSTILEFLEQKWNLSPSKLNRTADSWLKIPSGNQPDDSHHQQSNPPQNNSHLASDHQSEHLNGSQNNIVALYNNLDQDRLFRLRLKPSSKHELKEVNIARVVPDYHLDLSLNAYIRRLGDTKPKELPEQHQQTAKTSSFKDVNLNIGTMVSNTDEVVNVVENAEPYTSAMMSGTRLHESLTTPDCSILLERSCGTSDQPSLERTRKSLKMLQTLACSFEGCENSRTACEDTSDRSHLGILGGSLDKSSAFRPGSSSFGKIEPGTVMDESAVSMVNNSIPALLQEDAAFEISLPVTSSTPQPIPIQDSAPPAETSDTVAPVAGNLADLGSCKSNDFNIPKNLTLGQYLNNIGGQEGGDEANDAFPVNQCNDEDDIDDYDADNLIEKSDKDDLSESPKGPVNEPDAPNLAKAQNHMIEIKKLAYGLTRHDETSMTIGELYLAFKCPDKIILEYNFEQYNGSAPQVIQNIPDRTSSLDNPLLMKLLTAANLTLAQIERQKQQEIQAPAVALQGNGKRKRLKGSNQHTVLTVHDIATTNQIVEAQLKQLQPTRLGPPNRGRAR